MASTKSPAIAGFGNIRLGARLDPRAPRTAIIVMLNMMLGRGIARQNPSASSKPGNAWKINVEMQISGRHARKGLAAFASRLQMRISGMPDNKAGNLSKRWMVINDSGYAIGIDRTAHEPTQSIRNQQRRAD